MTVAVARTLVAAPLGVVPATVAARLPAVLTRPPGDALSLGQAPGGTLPAADVPLTAMPPAASGSLVDGLIDGARDNVSSLVHAVKDKPFLAGAVVLGYQALILTPLAGVVTGGLAALGVIGLAKKGIAVVDAHSKGDAYGAGKVLGSFITDYGLSSAPKMLGRLTGGVKATHAAADGLKGFDQLDDVGHLTQAESTLVSTSTSVLKSARIAKRGVGWVVSAQNLFEPKPSEPPAQPDA